jgi:lipoprotein Spr
MLINKYIRIFFLVAVIAGLNACKSSKNASKLSKKQKYDYYSQKLGILIDENCNDKLMESIIYWLGTPYKFSGCDKNGIDCSCLVKNIYSEVYKIELKRNSLEIFDACNLKSKEKLKEGDLIFFKTESNKVSHVGIYIKDNKFVHSSTKKGVMISDLKEPYFEKTYYKCGETK